MAQLAQGELMVEAVLACGTALTDNPELSSEGWRSEPDPDWVRGGSYHRYSEQVATALQFIDACQRIEASTRKFQNSYSLKHAAERWGRRNGLERYVSNGAFITAAIYRGLPVERWKGAINCGIAISSRALEKLRCFDA